MADAMQGIMGLSGQGAGPTTQNPMAGIPPEIIAGFEAGRARMTPQDISSGSVEALGEADPGMVLEMKQMLASVQMPQELLQALGELVDTILENPGDYDEIRADVMSDPEVADVFDDFLPLQFDAAYFGGLNIALDQIAVEPPAIQRFADGGLASLNLKPIAAELQKMGRNGDTMLAHITPGEARLLRSRGGSGTINPVTGLPEFFSLKKAFKKVVKGVKKVVKSVGNAVKSAVKSVGNVVKKIASSPIGRVVLTAAAVAFGGPMVASFLGTAAPALAPFATGITAGLANTAVSLASGASFKDSLKAGLTAGVMAQGTEFLGSKLFGSSTPAAGADATAGAGAATGVGDFSTAATGTATPSAVDYSLTGAQPYSSTVAAGSPAYSLTAAQPTAAPILPTPVEAVAAAAPTQPYFQGIGGLTPPLQPTMAQLTGAGGATSVAPMATQPGFFSQLADGEIMGALKTGASNVGDFYNEYLSPSRPGVNEKSMLSQYGPLMAAGTAAAYLGGAFNPVVQEAPGLIPEETGMDLLNRQPDVYGTAPGGANTYYSPDYTSTPGNMNAFYNPYAQGYGQGVGMGNAPRFQVQDPREYLSPQLLAMINQPVRAFNYGGIASLNEGGDPQDFPRKTGQISGPGTEKSDSIPAMLSDGEFVMTARAVRGAGGGSRREGAKRMYQMMHQFERNA